MYNLLSREDKKYVQKEYRYRLAILSIAVASGSLLVGIALLLPSYFFVESEKDVLYGKQVYAESLADKGEEGISTSELLAIKEKLDILSSDAERISVVELLSQIIYDRGDGISINGISYKKTAEDKVGEVEVSGVGRDRGSLVNFQDFLKRLDIFDFVELPISNYVQSEDIPFVIKMKNLEQ